MIQVAEMAKAELEYIWHVQGTSCCNRSPVNEKQKSKSKFIEFLWGQIMQNLGGHYKDWIMKYLPKVIETASGKPAHLIFSVIITLRQTHK